MAKEELQDKETIDLNEIGEEKVRQTIDSIYQALKDKGIDPNVKKLNYDLKNWPDNLKRYQEHEKILRERSSFKKTDPDSTFMRMKEYFMKDRPLKPGNNFQISTNNQYIANYSHHPNPTDYKTLPAHMDQFNKLNNGLPKSVLADAELGSEENYTLLEKFSN